MTDPDAHRPQEADDGAGAQSPWAQQRVAWWLLAPPAFTVGLRWVLAFLAARQPQVAALSLTPVPAQASVMTLAWSGLAILVVLGAGVVGVRKLGWRRVMAAAGVVWVALWLGASGALVQRYLNQQNLKVLPGAVAKVLGSQFKPPSPRGAGGTQLYLQLPGLEAPHSVLIDDAAMVRLRPGDALSLELAQGRFDGLFVTGWKAMPSPTATPAGSL